MRLLTLFFFSLAIFALSAEEKPITTDKVYIGASEATTNEKSEEELQKARLLKSEKRQKLVLAAKLSEARSGAKHVQRADGSYCANSLAQFMLQGEDDISGLNRFHYRLNDDAWLDYLGPVSIAQEGEHYLKWESIDRVGNREDQQSLKIRIDNTPPTLTPTPVGRFVTGRNGYTAAPQFQLAVRAHDAGCGVQAVYMNLDNGGWTPLKGTALLFEKPGTHHVQLMAEDILNNRSAIKQMTVTIDATPPRLVILASPAPLVENGASVCRPGTVVSLAAEDDETQVARIEYRYSPNNEWIGSMDTRQPLQDTREFFIEARAIDSVGNTTEQIPSFRCRVWGEPPTTKIIMHGGDK